MVVAAVAALGREQTVESLALPMLVMRTMREMVLQGMSKPMEPMAVVVMMVEQMVAPERLAKDQPMMVVLVVVMTELPAQEQEVE